MPVENNASWVSRQVKDATSLRMKKTEKKALLLSMAMVAATLLPMTTNAQQINDGNHGLFGRGGQTESSNREGGSGMEWSGGGMATQDPTQEAPLGSGLLILVATGAGYATLKRKEDRQ